MQNRGILACCLSALLLVSAAAAVAPARANGSDAIIKILDTASAEADGELQELRQNGVQISPDADSLYSAALSERQAASQAFEAGDDLSARAHAIKALDTFRNLFDLLAALEQQRGEEDDSGLIDAMDQDISNSQEVADNLKSLAAANNISIDFSRYDSAINATAEALSEGNLEEAEGQFALAQELVEDIHGQMQQASEARSEKAREFVIKTSQRLGSIVADLRENSSIPSDVRSAIIQRFESIIAQLENETDVEKIIEMTDDSSELQRDIDQYNYYRVENFDAQYPDIQQDIAALLADAGAFNIRIERAGIDSLLAGVREKIQAGQEEDAADELDRLDSLLDEIEGVIEEFAAAIEGVAETRAAAIDLRSEAAGNAAAIEEIARAMALVEDADSTIREAGQTGVGSGTIRDVIEQLQLARGLVQEANDILEEVEDGLADERERGQPPEAGMNMGGNRG